MEKLKELYQILKLLDKYNSSVPEEVKEQIRDAESEILNAISETIIGYLPEEIEMPSGSSVIVGVEYRDGKLVKVASSLNANLGDKFEHFSDVNNEEPDVVAEDPEDVNDRRRSKSIGFTVKFADGKIVKYSTAQRTMIEALRYMGLERASQYRGEMFKGFPLIGKEQRTTDGKRWQRMVDGWWVYINIANERKITCLKGVAKMLNIDLEIIPDDESEPEPEETETSDKHRSLYSLNGSAPMPKNRAALATVKYYLESEAPYFEEIQAAFPPHLQGSYGVVRTVEEIKERCGRHQTEYRRWFLDDDEILKSVDDIAFAVSTEWGYNFSRFIEHVTKVLKISLVEV